MSGKKKGKGLKVFLILLMLCFAAAVGFLIVRFMSVNDEVKRLEPFETECAELTEKVNALNEENAAQAEQIETLNGENAAQAEQIGTLNGQVASLKADNEAQAVLIADQAAEIGELKQNVNDYIGWQASLTSMVDGQASVNERLVRENAELAAKVDDSAALAAVEEGTFAATKRCVLMLQAHECSYLVVPAADESGEDEVIIVLRSETASGTEITYKMSIFLSADNGRAVLYVADVAGYDPAEQAAVEAACIRAMSDMRYVCFLPDEANACITAELDMLLPDSAAAGDVLWQAMCTFDTVMSEEYDALCVYAPAVLMLEPVTATDL